MRWSRKPDNPGQYRMEALMEWSDIHAYRHLAEEGKVKFLTCPNDDTKLTSRIGEDDEPVLWCPLCDNMIKPGVDLRDQIRAVVREHTP